MKKLSVKLLIIISFLFISTNANANMFNKFKKGFYFEKYSTAEEAKAALLELHPIGSDVEDLIKTLERAGGKCGIYREEMESYEYISSASGKKSVGKKRLVIKREAISEPQHDYYSFHYKVYGLQTMFFCAIDWSITIKVNSEDRNKTSTVEVNRDFFCL